MITSVVQDWSSNKESQQFDDSPSSTFGLAWRVIGMESRGRAVTMDAIVHVKITITMRKKYLEE